MALNKIGDQVTKNIRSIFVPEATSPAQKRERRDDSETAAKSGQVRPVSPVAKVPFSAQQINWMGNAVALSNEATLKIFGAHIEERFHAVESELTTQGQAIDQLKAKVDALESKVSPPDPELRSQVSQLQTQVQAIRAGEPSTLQTTDVPHGLKRHAVIGNLGWDAERDVVEERAVQILTQAGVTPDSYTNLSATRDKGSMVELWFNDPQELQRTRLTIRTLRKKFAGADKSAWLDVKKTREQLKPQRMFHRIAQFLEDIEPRKPEPSAITKDLSAKSVKRANVIMGYVFFGRWRWTTDGENAYDVECRQHAEHWANQE